MKSKFKSLFLYGLTAVMALGSFAPLNAQQAAKVSVPVTMTVTANVASDKRMPVKSLRTMSSFSRARNA